MNLTETFRQIDEEDALLWEPLLLDLDMDLELLDLDTGLEPLDFDLEPIDIELEPLDLDFS
jgi:hypothetical protein